MHTPQSFVADFHQALTEWFSGTGEQQATWWRLQSAISSELEIVFPSGIRMNATELLDGIRRGYGHSPEFEAEVSDLEVLHRGSDHAVVTYKETQRGARSSAPENERWTTALLVKSGDDWAWRWIQETRLPDKTPKPSMNAMPRRWSATD